MQENYDQYLAQFSQFKPMRIDVDHAEGIFIYDKKGKRFFDLHAGICVNNLGHRHPKIISAIRKQLDHYLHVNVYGEFVQEIQLQFASKLIKALKDPFEKCFLLSTGSEAIEGALKTAKSFTGKRDIVSFSGSYHGSTQSLMALLGDEKYKRPFRPQLPGNKILRFNCEEDLEFIDKKTAAVVIELIQTASGMRMIDEFFLQKLRKRCDEIGALLIFDEIQTSLGRCGNTFGFENFGVKPDIICLAKSLGGGLPLAAFAASAEIMNALDREHPLLGHATTFGGHPLSCAAGTAFLEVLKTEIKAEEIREKEQLFRSLLKHPGIRSIEGKGLLLAMHLEKDVDVKKYLEGIIEKGVISNCFLFEKQAISITPPLIITMKEIEEISRILLGGL